MRRKKIYKMNREEADRMLKSVFAATDVEPNKSSFDTILLRTIANTTMVKTCKWIAIVMLALVIASPLFFKSSDNFSVKDMSVSSQVTVMNHQLYEDRFEMVLSGTNIDYYGIYCKKLDGTIVMPRKINENEHLVVIPFDGDSLNIYITCLDGRVVQALLSK